MVQFVANHHRIKPVKDPVETMACLVQAGHPQVMRAHGFAVEPGEAEASVKVPSLISSLYDLWVDQEPEMFCDERMLRNYRRNEQLVDLEMVPNDIANQIMEQYLGYEVPKRSGLLNYFIKNKLKNLMDSIGDF